VSELCTNAVRASHERVADRGLGLPVVHLRLLSNGKRLVIEVWDDNLKKPAATDASEEDESGRGLMLVEAVCERYAEGLRARMARTWGMGRSPSSATCSIASRAPMKALSSSASG
jgi:two-component sensor histidine kinase